MAENTVRDIKYFKGSLYGVVDLGARPDKTRVSVTVKVTTGREDVAAALEPIKALLRREADASIKETIGEDTARQARLTGQKELAQRIIGQVDRGAMPDEIAKGLKPIAGR